MLDVEAMISDRARGMDASGIRRVFDLAARLEDPINLSIGQPDFDVPEAVREAACEAVRAGRNQYTQTQGTLELRSAIGARVAEEFPHLAGDSATGLDPRLGVLVTSGVSGALLLLALATLQPGDECVMPDPGFVMYRHLVAMAGATAVPVSIYPDLELTAQRVEAAITPRTKVVMVNSPANPTGVVSDDTVLSELAELCERRGVLLVSDEIYDEFHYAKAAYDHGLYPPSPLRHGDPFGQLLLRGFSKTYAMTGWRMGYAVGPVGLIEQMTKLQQYTFVCAPAPFQAAGLEALQTDMSDHVAAYAAKRDRVVQRLSPHFELIPPGGAFYAFPKVPERLGLTATEFVERAIQRNVLVIPGSVFSGRDTHFRLSYACDDTTLERGLDVLVELAGEA